MTGVASFILLADIGYQRLRTLQLNFEGGNQRVFGVNDNVFRFSLKFKANRKLHLCALLVVTAISARCAPRAAAHRASAWPEPLALTVTVGGIAAEH